MPNTPMPGMDMSTPGYTPPMGYIPPPAPKPEKKDYGPYLIWRYDGNGKTSNPQAPFTTYVFFNSTGLVEAVVVYLNDPKARTAISTESGIGFGTKMDAITEKYDLPDIFARVGSMYMYHYPAFNVTFSTDTTTRRVVCIAIGAPFTVTAQTIASTISTDFLRMTPSTASGMPMTPDGRFMPGNASRTAVNMGPIPPGGSEGYMPPGSRTGGGMHY